MNFSFVSYSRNLIFQTSNFSVLPTLRNSDFLNLDSKHKEGNLDTQNKGEPNQQNKNKILEPILETEIIETEQNETTYSV